MILYIRGVSLVSHKKHANCMMKQGELVVREGEWYKKNKE